MTLFRIAIASVSAATLWLTATLAGAIEVSPLLIEIILGRTPSSETAIRVESTERETVAIEISVFERLFDDNGEESLVPADDEFIIFPPQALLEPEQVQVFRFNYLGEPSIRSRNFYFNVAQIPVNLNATGNRVDVIVEFAASVNVSSPDTSPDSSIVAMTQQEPASPDEPAYLLVTIRNDGERHDYMSRQNFRLIDPAGQQRPVSGGEFRSNVGDTLVPAGGVRTFNYSLPENAAPGAWRLEFVRD